MPDLPMQPVPATQKTVSVVLGSYNRRPFLRAALDSIRANGMDLPYEIIVVDGGSTDGSLRYLASQKDVITIIQHNRGRFRGRPVERRSWGYFMNLGFKAAQGKYILMVSDDCLLVPGAIRQGVGLFERLLAGGRPVGALAFYWRDWPGEDRYWVGKTFGRMFVNHGLYLRRVVEALGGFDEERYRFYHADGDLCLRMWEAGYEVLDCPDAYVEHYAHANLRARKSNEQGQLNDWEAYRRRWSHLEQDPAGAALVRDYTDPHATYRKFPGKAARTARAFRQYAARLWRGRVPEEK